MKTSAKKTLTLALIFTMICAFIAGVALFATPAKAAVTTITIAETAEIRIVEPSGIRFMITINNDEYANLTKEGGDYEGYTASVGAVILPSVILGSAELKVDSSYSGYYPVVKFLTNTDVKNSDQTSTRYNVVMTNIPFTSYEQELSARGFIELVKDGETTKYIYTDTTAKRSIAQVATLAYKADSTDEAVKADIATLLQNAITGCKSWFDKETYDLAVNETTSFKFYGNAYGFEPTSEWLAENVQFVSNDENVATIANGIITAKNAGSTTITAKMGDTVLATTNVVVDGAIHDNAIRALSIADGTLDLTGLADSLADVTSIEINDTVLSVTEGKLPAMTMVTRKNDSNVNHLELTVAGIANAITINRTGNNKDFDALPMTITLTDGTQYLLSGVQVYNKVLKNADDITWLFGAENATNHLDGYYVLGNNIDASTANVSGGLRFSTTATDSTYGSKSQFVGLFDGMGYTISNLNLSGTYSKPGSLFGQMVPSVSTSAPTVQNVAFANVKATFASIISTTANHSAVKPYIRNVYVNVSADTTDFMGIARSTAGSIDHCIVEYPVKDTTTHSKGGTHEYGSFVPTANGVLALGSNNYVISETPVAYVSATDATEKTSTFVTRYENLAAMKAANNDYSSFNDYWTIKDGIPVWKSMPILPVIDSQTRALSIADGSLDLSGLDFTMADVASVTINGSTLAVTDGKLPNMTMKAVGNTQLALTVEGLSDTITIGKVSGNKDFNSLPMTFVLNDDSEYTLSGVQVYNKVLKNADDITWLFGAENATNHLDGYYVLGNNIDASTANVSGGLRFSTTATDSTYGSKSQFVGLFDGMGYTISNLNLSGTYSKPGSLFGQMIPSVSTAKPTVQNVAFVNVNATYAAVISTTANYATVQPVISNVYVKVSENTTSFMGLARSTAGNISNCIIDYPVYETTYTKGGYNEYGSFAPVANGTPRGGNNYVISKTPISYTSASDNTETTAFSAIVKRYEDLTAMKAAGNNYSSFNYCWTIVDGIPVWANLPQEA